jgi:hypothetical protein
MHEVGRVTWRVVGVQQVTEAAVADAQQEREQRAADEARAAQEAADEAARARAFPSLQPRTPVPPARGGDLSLGHSMQMHACLLLAAAGGRGLWCNG